MAHLTVDVALANDDLDHRWTEDGSARLEPLAASHAAAHGGGACPAEEAFCEAYALRFLDAAVDAMADLTAAQREEIRGKALEHVQDGPQGYRDGADIVGPDGLFRSLSDLLTHAGVPEPERAALTADLNRHTVGPADTLIHIVVTPGSALERDEWLIANAR